MRRFVRPGPLDDLTIQKRDLLVQPMKRVDQDLEDRSGDLRERLVRVLDNLHQLRDMSRSFGHKAELGEMPAQGIDDLVRCLTRRSPARGGLRPAAAGDAVRPRLWFVHSRVGNSRRTTIAAFVTAISTAPTTAKSRVVSRARKVMASGAPITAAPNALMPTVAEASGRPRVRRP